MKKHFTPEHINAVTADLEGNNGIGRYVFLPGSDARAKLIADHFEDLRVKTHSRGHHLYLGNIKHNNRLINVASIATGMGCPSAEIIIHELFNLGAKRFLRVGTAGSLQEGRVHIGDLINVQASVRDEDTTEHYVPVEFPALASFQMTTAINAAAKQLSLHKLLHTGIVHCKSAFYAAEFCVGPKENENRAYIKLLVDYGVLASEMETATLFVQTQVFNQALSIEDNKSAAKVLAGAILMVVSDFNAFDHSPAISKSVDQGIQLALQTIKILFDTENAN